MEGGEARKRSEHTCIHTQAQAKHTQNRVCLFSKANGHQPPPCERWKSIESDRLCDENVFAHWKRVSTLLHGEESVLTARYPSEPDELALQMLARAQSDEQAAC